MYRYIDPMDSIDMCKFRYLDLDTSRHEFGAAAFYTFDPEL